MYVYTTPTGIPAKIVFSQNKGTGITECQIYTDMSLVASGTARCSHKERSGFVPKKGKKIALLKAMLAAGWTKNQREGVWQELDARGWLREGEKFRG